MTRNHDKLPSKILIKNPNSNNKRIPKQFGTCATSLLKSEVLDSCQLQLSFSLCNKNKKKTISFHRYQETNIRKLNSILINLCLKLAIIIDSIRIAFHTFWKIKSAINKKLCKIREFLQILRQFWVYDRSWSTIRSCKW